MPPKKKAVKTRAPRVKTNELSRLLFDANPQPTWLYDRDSLRIIEVNESAVRKYGYSRAEFLLLDMTAFLPADEIPLLQRRVSGLVSGANTVWQSRHRLKGQTMIDVDVVAHPIPWEGREAVLTIVFDVTDQKRVEGALRGQQAAAMKASMDGMAILDHEGRYVYLNEAHAKVYGYEAPEQLIARSWTKLYPPKELERFEREIMPAFWKTGQWHGEAVGRRRDGTLFPQEISLSKIDAFSEAGDGMVCVVRDISQRKLAEDEHQRLFLLEKNARTEAEAASRAKDEFLALVSHELRTPMTAILGWTWLLRSGEAEFGRALDIIERNMKLQAQIIEDLLDVSSIVTGKLNLDKRPIDLGPVLQQAADTVRGTADAKRVSLKLDSHDVVVLGDPYRLQQVLWNLLSNAIKFNQEGGLVHVTIRSEKGRAVISVMDDGQGIDADFLPAVFDPFRQAESSLTRRHSGLGIGLAIVRHLVELHAGTVKAHSEGTGKGAVFTVDLPLHVGKPAKGGKQAPKTPEAPSGQTLEGLRILLVDDEPDTLTMLSVLLKFHGAVVTTAFSAASAMAALTQERQDLIISDIAMPEEDGLSLIRRVRALEPHKGGEICAMALTACAKSEDRDLALAAGFQVYMAKPVEPAELLAVIRRLARATPYSK